VIRTNTRSSGGSVDASSFFSSCNDFSEHREPGPHRRLPGGRASPGRSGVQVRTVPAAVRTRSSRCHALDGHGILIVLAPPPAERHVVEEMQMGLTGLAALGAPADTRYGIYFLLGRVYTKYTHTRKH